MHAVNDTWYKTESNRTNEPRRHTVEVHASAIIAWPWPLTSDLENLLAMPTHVGNICVKFRPNLPTV